MNNDSTTTGAPGAGEPRDLSQLSTRQLAARLVEETSLFLKARPSDGRYGLELFRRAIALRDEAAWEYLYGQYHPLVLTWVNQHQSVAQVLAQEGGAASLVNAAFAKFSQALTPAKMVNFDSLAALLKYLKMCAPARPASTKRRSKPSSRNRPPTIPPTMWSR
jgi:hypothetical protein